MRAAVVAVAALMLAPAAGAASDPGAKAPKAKTARSARLYVAPAGTNGNRWTHLAGTYDGSTLRLYVDGLEAASLAAGGAMPASARPLRIGGNAVWGEWFAGAIDDVRVYERALSAAELREDMAAGVGSSAARPGLVAAYSFDAAGPTAADASGNGNTGAVAGATWTGAGRHGGALAFDGVDDWVTVAGSPSLDLGAAATFSAWVNPAELGEWRTALVREQPGNLVYALYANTGAPGRAGVPSAHVYLGDDLSARGDAGLPLNSCRDRAQPCRTFDHAYRAAQPGQTIEVAGGGYPAQALRPDPGKASAAAVVFAAAKKAEPRIAGLEVRASHVTFDSLTIDGDWHTHDETDDVTFRDLTVNGAIFVSSSSNIRVLGGSVGGIRDYKPQLASWPPGTRIEHVLVDGVRFHDIRRTSEDVHIECLLVGGGLDVTIRNSRFEGCSVFDLSIGEFNGSGPPERFLIENNFFGASDGFHSLHFNTNTSALHDVVVRNNSSTQHFYHGNAIPLLDGVRFVANVAPLAPGDCEGRIVYRRNVWDGGTCGATDLDAPSGFADAAAGDLHLTPGAAAIGGGDPEDHPAADIDGDRRPRGRGVDAGADER